MEKNNELVSVIIPLKKCNSFLEENINAIINGSYSNFEIIVLPDAKEKKTFSKTRIIPTGNIGPAEKRNKGARIAKGKILAFIDDDAYPSKDWLKNAGSLFQDRDVSAVCGPGVTPPADSVLQKVSGAFNASLLGAGPYTYRFIPQQEREVDDYPSMNFLVRKSDFWNINGFNANYWPGEDTKFCLDLTKKIGKKILYHPSVLVYHHRRAIFSQHLLQNGRYGLHRGHFARILPKTSFRISYFFPSILLVSVFSLPFFLIINKQLFILDLLFVCFYVILVLFSSITYFIIDRNIIIAFLLIPTIMATHLFYGFKFLEGFFFTSNLKL